MDKFPKKEGKEKRKSQKKIRIKFTRKIEIQKDGSKEKISQRRKVKKKELENL